MEETFQMDENRREEILELLNKPLFNIVAVNESSLNLYDQALTHSTYAKEMKDRGLPCADNERLEFFGNFVLNFVVSEYIFNKFKDDSEGSMTKRMEIVSDEILAEIIRKKGIGIEKYLNLGGSESGKGEDLEDSIVAGAFEALIGAVYLDHRDQDMTKIREIILPLLSDAIEHFDPDNYIGRLQERLAQIKTFGDLQYAVERIGGPDHEPTFRAIVKISGKLYGEGSGKNKRAAKMEAAKVALDKLSTYPENPNQL
jgi:ribonuclease-3